MTAMFKPKLTLAVALVLITCTAAVVYHNRNVVPVSADTIFLLLPDSAAENDVQVQVWLDAAAEEGFHLQVVRDSTLLDPMFQMSSGGLIVPDQLHRRANDALIGALHHYVEQGGKLMIAKFWWVISTESLIIPAFKPPVTTTVKYFCNRRLDSSPARRNMEQVTYCTSIFPSAISRLAPTVCCSTLFCATSLSTCSARLISRMFLMALAA